MKDKLLKGLDFVAEGLWRELFHPILMWFLIITVVSFSIVGLILLAAMLGIGDYKTMMTALLEFSQNPWWKPY